MENSNGQVIESINLFFKSALKCLGKEIGLESNQFFSIDQVIDADEKQNDEDNYVIQYGFPQSGCVIVNFKYSKVEKNFTVYKISVDAPPAEKDMMIANFAPQMQNGPFGISANFGLDMGTKEHTSIQEIEGNPNALKMLQIAAEDLSQAQILGESMVTVSGGGNRIPCCTCTKLSDTKRKSK